jgi:ankyrin repeat protein
MMRAALNEEIHAMKILKQYGGDIAQTDSDGCTTLHYMAQDGNLEMVKYLISQGAPVGAQCRGGQTALKWAYFGENKEVIEYLESL